MFTGFLFSLSEFDYPSAVRLFWVFRFLKVVVWLEVWSGYTNSFFTFSHRSLAIYVIYYNTTYKQAEAFLLFNIYFLSHLHKHVSTDWTMVVLHPLTQSDISSQNRQKQTCLYHIISFFSVWSFWQGQQSCKHACCHVCLQFDKPVSCYAWHSVGLSDTH